MSADASLTWSLIESALPLKNNQIMKHEEHAPAHWRINLAEPWEVAFWAKELECSEGALRAAVETVGTVSHDVRTFLQQVQQRLH